MINIFILLCIICLSSVTLLVTSHSNNEKDSKYDKKSNVFFTANISSEGVQKVFEKLSKKIWGKIGVKVHFGEEGNENYLNPALVKDLMEMLNASFVETNVLYASKRRFTESHIQLAKDHGFDFAPIDILDDEGEIFINVDYKHLKKLRTGNHIDFYDSLVIFSHFKGHLMAGFGGAIKNASMGLASIPGKMAIHASSLPIYHAEKCNSCKACVKECHTDAISLNPFYINPSKCNKCGMCIGVCSEKVIKIPRNSTEEAVFLERLIEYAKGISDYKNMIFINVVANVSKSCDCDSNASEPVISDIGVLGSTDMIALEKACYDLVYEALYKNEKTDEFNHDNAIKQFEYAETMKLGTMNYNLIKLDDLS